MQTGFPNNLLGRGPLNLAYVCRIRHFVMPQNRIYLSHPAVVRVKSEAVDEDDVNYLFCVYIKPHFDKCWLCWLVQVSGMIQTIANAKFDKNIPQL